jgi:hypothetical protein
MGSVAEYPEEETCQACTEPAEGSIKYLGDRLCNRCAAVLWAAQALVDNGYTDGPEVIPTLVFAALSTEEPLFEDYGEGLATEEWTSWRADLLRQILRNSFAPITAPHSVWALADGVLIIRPTPIEVKFQPKGDRQESKVTIDVVDVSVKPEQVAERYKESAKSLGLDTDYYEEGEGELGWQVAPGIIHMEISPALVDPDTEWSVKRPPRPRLSYPPPEMIGDLYSVLRGSTAKGKFRGYGRSVLPGNLTNKPHAMTLVPACVAWYLAGRQKPRDKATKIKIVQLLNRHLLTPCGLETLSEGGSDFIRLWRDVGKHAEALIRVEQTFVETLRSHQVGQDHYAIGVAIPFRRPKTNSLEKPV